MYIVAFILVLVLVVCCLYGKGSIKFVKSKSERAAPLLPARSPPRKALPLPYSAPFSPASRTAYPKPSQALLPPEGNKRPQPRAHADLQEQRGYKTKGERDLRLKAQEPQPRPSSARAIPQPPD